jgi:hypothetical protein
VLKKIIILAGAGLLSFVGAFALTWFTRPDTAIQAATPEQTTPEQTSAEQNADSTIPPPPFGAGGGTMSNAERVAASLSQEQLKALIREVREKIEEYNIRLTNLKVREDRVKLAHDALRDDIKELETLRVELASGVAQLKKQRDELIKSRIRIRKDEEVNLATLAAAYDKMEPTSASQIIASMGKAQNGNSNDAVKILHYMQDRTKAELLAALATLEPDVAAYYCQKLKQVVVEE